MVEANENDTWAYERLSGRDDVEADLVNQRDV